MDSKTNNAGLILSGPSGAGKGTVVKKLLNQYPDLFELSVSLTTRQPRETELDGREYHFVKKEDFLKEVELDSFMEYCSVHDYHYGTHKKYVEDIRQRGKIPILEIDVQGGEKIHKLHPEWNYVYLYPPSLEIMKQRLIQRWEYNQNDYLNYPKKKQRIQNAEKELQTLQSLSYYTGVLNDNIDVCFEDVLKYLAPQYETMKF